jgi:catechol 2,3-dioxygenase-like lactoylglutathione lyase family enzyme
VFDHIDLRVSDRDAAERFYTTVLAALGLELIYTNADLAEWGEFALHRAEAAERVTRRLHIGFAAPSRERVDAFHRAGVEAGYRDDGAPGLRPQYRPDYYGAFLLDPDGNSAEAVHYDGVRDDGWIDHLWLRVADVDAATRFYEAIAPVLGLEIRRHAPDHSQVARGKGSLSLVAGEPTENVHFAFPADGDEQVQAFHRAGVDAGYRDSGAPGERPHYHAGYYAAFLLDPDGNNSEAVDHHR